MIACKIKNTKDFMNKLLTGTAFDNFLLQEAVITGAASYVIDGRVNPAFFSEEELEELELKTCRYLPFSLLRANCFDLIKGKKTPLGFKFVFLLSPDNLKKTLSSIDSGFTENDITGMFLNVKFQDGLLTLTTGISYRTFSLDKQPEIQWDRLVQKFLAQLEIEFEEL